MVKCDACLMAHEVRYTKPPGICEHCRVVTPYQDKLCSSCSDAAQRCQCCRSKRVVALVSLQPDTAAVLAALASRNADTTAKSARGRSAASIPQRDEYASLHALPSPSATSATLLASSPFHFQAARAYLLPPPEADADATANAAEDEQWAATMHASPAPSDGDLDAALSSSSHSLLLSPSPSAGALSTTAARSSPSGSVVLSPSGRLIPATLTPLSPRMAVQQNAAGVAAEVRDPLDARDLVATWPRAELVEHVFSFYCAHNRPARSLALLLPPGKFRLFARDAGLIAQPSAAPSSAGARRRGGASKPALLSTNRLDILYTACTRPLSGQNGHMSLEQFFEVLGAVALWVYGGAARGIGAPSNLPQCLEQLFENNIVPLAEGIVLSRANGVALRQERFDAHCTSTLLRYEKELKKIFVRLVRETFPGLPVADERLTHPLLESGWKLFAKSYDFFPSLVSASTVMRVFLATASGMSVAGNHDRPAQSFDDFVHGVFQLSQVAFTLTPHALPIERLELALALMDAKARELHFTPVSHREGETQATRASAAAADRERLVEAYERGGQDAPVDGEERYSALYALFPPASLACARDLFNVYANSTAQVGYSEQLPRLGWVRLLRDSGLIDQRGLTSPDGDLIFARVLASTHQASDPTSTGFAKGRSWSFEAFLTGLLDAVSKRFPNRATSAALSQAFSQFLQPLLARKVEQIASKAPALPVGAGLNSAGSPQEGRATWGEARASPRGSEEEAKESAITTLYPNHPSSSAPLDVDAIMSSDAQVQSLLAVYGPKLHEAFFRASWEGVEAHSGVAIPRISSSLLIHAAPLTSLANQQSWDRFLQQKELLSEHAFRRWLSQQQIVPDLIAHRQVTQLFREGNVGFDRTQNQFVLNYQEFLATLMRAALLAFSGAGYRAYTTPASRLELLLFLVDQNSAGSLAFKGFSFGPRESTLTSDFALMSAAGNMGRQLAERKCSTELGVRALLMGEAAAAQTADDATAVPQDWGHGARGAFATPAVSASHAALPRATFNTSTSVPRIPFATQLRTPAPVQEARPQRPGSSPNASPTRALFQQTPFVKPQQAKRGGGAKTRATVDQP